MTISEQPEGQTPASRQSGSQTPASPQPESQTPASPPAASASASASATGRLAQVIATRGGLAPPEAPFVIEHREALIYMLCEAAELEHGIMCQYLYAAFSLKQNEGPDSTDTGLSAAELAAARRWRKVISHVATQEMLHLALVQNLLSAVGAAPHLSRPNFPHPANHYPAGVHLALLPFGEEAVRHFMFLERPEGMDIHDADGMTAFGKAVPMMQAGDIVPRGQDFKTVGHMYRSIEAGFRHLVDEHGEDWLFVGPPRAQATTEYFGWPELVPVTDLASALRAIDEILEQGEGPRGAWQNAHFGQFVEILDEYTQAKEANLGLMATRPIQTVNVRPCDNGAEVPLVTDPVTARVMDLFNVGYEILLAILERFFAHTDESDTQLKTLADTSVGLMAQVIRPLGDLITTLPAGPDYPGQNAGPSFELFYESDYLLPHRDAAWTLLAERLDVAAGFAQEIVDGDPDGPAGPAPANVAPVVAQAGATLAQLAGALAAFLPPSAARSPSAPGTDSARASAPADADLAALQARADQFHLQKRSDGPGSDLSAGLADGIERTWSLTRQLLQPGPATTAVRWLAPRLIDSVLRPLSDALRAIDTTPSPATPPTSGTPSSPTASPNPNTSINPGTPSSPTAPPNPDTPSNSYAPPNSGVTPATADPTAPAEQVWQLAQDLTRLRVHAHQAADAQAPGTRAPGPRAAEPALAEATAALQDLACALAPAAGRAATFRDLQADLPASIEVAENGPYLATNVATIRDYLGQPVPVPPQLAPPQLAPPQLAPPQLALCRCGDSAIKPFCDGSHASNGFSGDKDPKRVPDHRDQYDGEQVTVFDNRGICQHSGYCTDRLNTVFRTSADPFVAPSGGRMDEIVRAVRDCPSGALGLAFDGHEERALADWHGTREAAIEITKDGPYRVTGTIPLTGPDGAAVPQNAGASREHYALCRCGHSQNKPFCSGMHWYIGFSHPELTPGRVPSLFEWAGGEPGLTQLTRRLYEKLIPADALLAPVFADLPPGYPEREARRIGAAFGGPEGDAAGSPAGDAAGDRTWASAVIGEFPAAQQARWVTLAGQAAGEVGLPADPQFRAALTAFFTWYASDALAAQDGQQDQGGQHDQDGQPRQTAALPAWGWTAAGPPDTSARPDTGADAEPVTLPGPNEPVSFAAHVKPLFRAKDRQSMLFAFDLWSYDDVRAHAAGVLERLANGSMPCDGSWPDEQIQVFRRWTQSGTPA